MDKINEKDLLKFINKANEKKSGKFSKRIVALVIFLNVVFTSAVLYVFLRIGSEPSTLIISWFAFTTSELLALSSIKKKEIKEENYE